MPSEKGPWREIFSTAIVFSFYVSVADLGSELFLSESATLPLYRNHEYSYWKFEQEVVKSCGTVSLMLPTAAEGGDGDLEGMLERKHEWESTTKKASHRYTHSPYQYSNTLPITQSPYKTLPLLTYWPAGRSGGDHLTPQETEWLQIKVLFIQLTRDQNSHESLFFR